MQSADFANMRRAMVDSQLRTSGVTEAWVLDAMGSTAREDFVPESARATAYMDRAITLSDGSVLNPPVATALMLQAAEIGPGDKVLLVGAGDGYTAAVLKRRNVQLTATVDGADSGKGFSVLFIDGAIEEVPSALLAAMQEGGRVVTGLVERGVTSLASGVVHNGQVALRRFADSDIAPLPRFARKREFVF